MELIVIEVEEQDSIIHVIDKVVMKENTDV